MSVITLDQAIDTVMQLSPQQQEMLMDILYKRHIERRRKEIAQDAQQSLTAFRVGQFKTQSAAEVIEELHQALDEAADE